MCKKIMLTILGIILIYGSVAFAIKAGLGVLPVDASITAIAQTIGMKVGTFSMIFHGCFFLGQIVMEKKEFQKTQLLQILYITLGGSVLNFILYVILKNITFELYLVKLIVMIVAFIVSAFGCTLVLETRLMRTPMEGCIEILAERRGTTMGKLRQKIDMGLLIVSVLLMFLFHTEWVVREGTVIAAIIFGPAMDFWKRKVFSR